jgi:hypothetical protein
MELSPSREANSCSAAQDIRSNLWKPKVHYRVHKSLRMICPEPDESSSDPNSIYLGSFSLLSLFRNKEVLGRTNRLRSLIRHGLH